MVTQIFRRDQPTRLSKNLKLKKKNEDDRPLYSMSRDQDLICDVDFYSTCMLQIKGHDCEKP